jgi:hypothetical protein
MKKLLNHHTLLAIIWMACTFNVIHAQTTVSGLASYRGDSLSPLVGISILLYDSDKLLLETTQTDNSGNYEFTDLPQGVYSLTGSSTLPPGEINIIDALMVADHIEGVRLLEGLALLAADVDGDGEITWADYDYILIDHLVYGYPFPVGDWVFEQIEFTIDSSSGSSIVHDVEGGSTADVKDKDKPDEMKSASHDYKPLMVSTFDKEIFLDIHANNVFDMTGFLIGLTIPAELFEIIEVSCSMPDYGYGLFDDRIIISAAAKAKKPVLFQTGDMLVQIKIKPKQQIANIDNINFELTGNSHFVNENLKLFSPQLLVPSLNFNIRSNSCEALLAVWPNPVVSQLNIKYNLEEDAHTILSIYSLDGKLHHTLVDQRLTAGSYEALFNRNGLPQGLYILRLSLQGPIPSSVVRTLLFTPE